MILLENYSHELPRSELSRKRIRSGIIFVIAMIGSAFFLGFLFDLGSEPQEEYVLSDVEDFPGDHIWFNSNEPLSLYDQLSRHVVVVFFCRLSTLTDLQYFSRLEAIHEEFIEEPFAVIAVIQTEETSIDELRSIIKDWGIEFPVIIDNTGTVSSRFNVNAFPSVLVLDSRARVSARFYVGWEKADLRGIVDDLLQQLRAMRYSQIVVYRPDGGSFIPNSIHQGN
ncbi:MAG: redoxin domain-containing protein [Candidatus Aegiribacteria sp.]|nr:redoxin domain-containing protein [Candidatus Aegiribacteria sp.]